MTEPTRTITFRPAHDCMTASSCTLTDRTDERSVAMCNKTDGRHHGRGAVRMFFTSRMDDVAVTLEVSTGWYHPSTPEWVTSKLREPIIGPLSVHRRQEPKAGYVSINERCDLLDDQPCYLDLTYTGGDPVYAVLVTKGEEAFWQALEGWAT